MKNVTDFCKPVETGVDPRLSRYVTMPWWRGKQTENGT